MFVGTFEHSLDDKGRFVLPAVFRQQFDKTGVLCQYDQCIGLWTPEGFEEVAGRLKARVQAGEVSQLALRAFSANAHTVKPDTQGRIGVPERLREFGGLDREVVVIGALDRIEIWDARRWRALEAASDQSLTDAITRFGI